MGMDLQFLVLSGYRRGELVSVIPARVSVCGNQLHGLAGAPDGILYVAPGRDAAGMAHVQSAPRSLGEISRFCPELRCTHEQFSEHAHFGRDADSVTLTIG